MKKCFILLLFNVVSLAIYAKDYTVYSPDKKLKVIVTDEKVLEWSIQFADEILLLPSKLMLKVGFKEYPLGYNPVIQRIIRNTADQIVEVIIPVKQRKIREHYNEMTLKCKGSYNIIFRVYNNGAAYRFETDLNEKEIFISDEIIEFNLAGDFNTYWPKEASLDMITHCEGDFEYLPISSISETKYAYLPIYLSSNKGTKMVIMDAGLFDYPNLFLCGTGGTSLKGRLPPVILEKEAKNSSDRDENIIKNTDYLAKTEGKRTFPWRLVMINGDDKSLLENNLVYLLSPPSVCLQADWIKPGRVSWDWWSNLNIYGVDFTAGINTETYKYFIDFASNYGLEYVLLDEGWSVSTTNIRQARPEIDLEELVRYSEFRGVGLILWALWKPLEGDIEGILDVYREWGIKGIKIDFMQRSDQDMVNFYENVAKAAFDRKLLVAFHGSFKPSGLHRKYPNIITYEGVYGAENNKVSYGVTPKHNLLLPFTRMTAGPMDYTPGATLNSEEGAFCISWGHPMSQGTRAHQAAMFIVYESPLQMIADSPSNYYRNPEFIEFIAQVPTVWDETKVLSGTIGEEISVARRNKNKWYIAAMTNWNERKKDIKLDFIGDKEYDIHIYQDGVNANRQASDFKVIKKTIKKGDVLNIYMYKGGGWAAILTPRN